MVYSTTIADRNIYHIHTLDSEKKLATCHASPCYSQRSRLASAILECFHDVPPLWAYCYWSREDSVSRTRSTGTPVWSILEPLPIKAGRRSRQRNVECRQSSQFWRWILVFLYIHMTYGCSLQLLYRSMKYCGLPTVVSSNKMCLAVILVYVYVLQRFRTLFH